MVFVTLNRQGLILVCLIYRVLDMGIRLSRCPRLVVVWSDRCASTVIAYILCPVGLMSMVGRVVIW